MSRTLTISAASGRIFSQRQTQDAKGHLITIDFSTSTSSSSYCSSYHINAHGDILTSDSRGNITHFLIRQNRYSQYIKNISPCSFIYQTSEDTLALIKTKELYIYNTSGKKLNEFKQHYSSIIGVDFNVHKHLFLTYSSEIAIIWDTITWKQIRNMRSKGNAFLCMQFYPDGNSILTNFDDGKLYMWRLSDNKLENQFAFSDIVRFTLSFEENCVYGVGRKGQIFVWRIDDTSKIAQVVQTIPGTTDLIQIKSTNEGLFAVGNNGRFYAINTKQWRVEYELQLGLQIIQSFDIKCDKLALGTNKGLVHVYELNTLNEKNAFECQQKIARGLEKDLVYTFLIVQEPDDREIFEEADSQPSLMSKEDIVFTKIGREYVKTPIGSSDGISTVSQENKCQHDLFKKIFGVAKMTPHETSIKHCNLKKIFQVKGEYPEKYRGLIWRFMLQLPNNVDSFAGLYSRGTHPDLITLFQNFKKTSQNEFSRTERVTSALCYWSSLLGKVDYLPLLVNSFIKVFPGDDLSAFESVMALILHWMQHWFEFFPSPPVVLIESISNIIKFHDKELFLRLANWIDLNQTIWKILRTFLNSVIAHADWIKLMDYIFTEWQNPETLLYAVACFVLNSKKILKSMTSPDEVVAFFEKTRKINILKFVKMIQDIQNNAGAAVVSFNVYLPICSGQYPLFTSYPQYKIQTKEEMAEDILREMEEKDTIRSYNIALQEKVKGLAKAQTDIVIRTKNLMMSDEDIIEGYHRELLERKAYLANTISN